MHMIDLEKFDDWNIQKKKLHSKKSNIYFREWDVWWASLWMNVKSESFWKWDSFRRPILIFKKLSSDTCIAIPLSSKIKTWSWFCKFSLHNMQRTALLHQIRMIHKNRFQRKIWELEQNDLVNIKKKLSDLLSF